MPGGLPGPGGLGTVYHADKDIPGGETAQANLRARRPRYIDLDEANVFRLEDIYQDLGGFNGQSIVFCDVFEKTRGTGKKTGMPILYYRATFTNRNQDYTDGQGIKDDIYYYPDNQALLELGTGDNTGMQHPLGDGQDDWRDFERLILDPRITVIKYTQRPDSYILISAGPDGLYGTSDDICNFDRW